MNSGELQIDELQGKDLRLLVDAAVATLAPDEEHDRLTDLPSPRAAAELRAELEKAGVPDADAIVADLTDRDRGEDHARLLLRAILADPEPAAEIVAAYRERESMMTLDAGLITGPVLLAILLLRIKRIKINKQGLDIQFAESKGLTSLFDFLDRNRGA